MNKRNNTELNNWQSTRFKLQTAALTKITVFAGHDAAFIGKQLLTLWLIEIFKVYAVYKEYTAQTPKIKAEILPEKQVTIYIYLFIYIYIYRVSQEEWTKLRDSVPYVELYRYNPKHLYPKLNGYGDNGHRKVWASGVSTYCTPSVTPYSSIAHARQRDTTS